MYLGFARAPYGLSATNDAAPADDRKICAVRLRVRTIRVVRRLHDVAL